MNVGGQTALQQSGSSVTQYYMIGSVDPAALYAGRSFRRHTCIKYVPRNLTQWLHTDKRAARLWCKQAGAGHTSDCKYSSISDGAQTYPLCKQGLHAEVVKATLGPERQSACQKLDQHNSQSPHITWEPIIAGRWTSCCLVDVVGYQLRSHMVQGASTTHPLLT